MPFSLLCTVCLEPSKQENTVCQISVESAQLGLGQWKLSRTFYVMNAFNYNASSTVVGAAKLLGSSNKINFHHNPFL